jgi:outer membrane scaffolding protein for murein synthesis (MipA/OmpV family)
MRYLFQLLFLCLLTILVSTVITARTASADGETLDEIDLWMDTAEDISEAPGYEDPEAKEGKKDKKDKQRDWGVSIGIAGGIAPDYEGSDDYDFGYGPDLALVWQDTIFFKGKNVRANLINEKNIKAGITLSYGSGRSEDSNDKLEGLGDVDSSIEVGGFMSYRIKPMRFGLNIIQDIGSGHKGALVELSSGTNLPFKKPLVFLSVGTTWASDNYMESFFGIDSRQSADSGLQKYNADAGFKDVNLNLTSGYSITKRWRIGVKLGYKRLVGDAADSPVVDDKNQFLAGIGLTYNVGLKVLADDEW